MIEQRLSEQRGVGDHGWLTFFKGLAPEGWLRKRYSEIQKIDDKDLFGLLMENGNDLLGA
ncbi:HipA N-terminal domain-containing protein, partial [Pantoea agglomerans]|uniref:HipA N-terminal domain-containing protein n=1 Tax=Enterobacter agglomerans TaxID=549 RepID=UPI0023DEE49E